MKWNRGFGLALRCFMRLPPWQAISTAATSAATNNSVCEGWAGTRQHMREIVLRLDDCRARVVCKQPKRQDISEGPPGEAVLPRLPVSKRLRDSPNPPSASASCPSHTSACWRKAALDTQIPLILVLPGPQPQATCMIMSTLNSSHHVFYALHPISGSG
jgi:hypothetical protein